VDTNFKIVEVFQHLESDYDLARRLVWENKEHTSQYIVQSLDDPENLYYAEDFIALCYGVGHKVVIHDD